MNVWCPGVSRHATRSCLPWTSFFLPRTEPWRRLFSPRWAVPSSKVSCHLVWTLIPGFILTNCHLHLSSFSVIFLHHAWSFSSEWVRKSEAPANRRADLDQSPEEHTIQRKCKLCNQRYWGQRAEPVSSSRSLNVTGPSSVCLQILDMRAGFNACISLNSTNSQKHLTHTQHIHQTQWKHQILKPGLSYPGSMAPA
jgi:hypothetical protein